MPALALVAASVIQLRADAPAVGLEDARAMSAPQLADTLLAPGHPPAVEALVGPQGMEPPPPPGVPVATRIRLYLAAKPAERTGFCEKTFVTVTMAPAAQTGGGDTAPARPAALSTQTGYRWPIAAPGKTAGCEARHGEFFLPDDAGSSFGLVELLAKAAIQARGTDPLPFVVTIDDQLGVLLQKLERRDGSIAPPPMTDSRAALAQAPIGAIWSIMWQAGNWQQFFPAADLARDGRPPLEGVTLFMGGEWTAGIALDGDRIVRIRLRRAVPPPF